MLKHVRERVIARLVDLKGSMRPPVDRDPKQAQHLLPPVLERMGEAIHSAERMMN
jgi:hypothetical protein